MFLAAGIVVALFLVGCLVAVYWGVGRGSTWLFLAWGAYLTAIALNFLRGQILDTGGQGDLVSWVFLAAAGMVLAAYTWWRGASDIKAPLETDWDAITREELTPPA